MDMESAKLVTQQAQTLVLAVLITMLLLIPTSSQTLKE